MNLDAVFLVTREFLRGLRVAGDAEKEKAAVVLVGSTAGQFGLVSKMEMEMTSSLRGCVTRRGARKRGHGIAEQLHTANHRRVASRL